ncbi:MAG TPA: hypothetical protein VM165_18200, partial [Planctomycetaceae bacterium]|nr:hypothetical protein [Planctomycetaceae bacterium]
HVWLAASLAVTTIAPYVVFCGLRWSVVGHAGLVSFGGYNIVGIAGQAIDEPLLSELSADVQPLAREILQRRRSAAVPSDYTAMVDGFNPVIWEVAVPAAKELYDNDTIRINHAFSQLSREVLQRRPEFYMRWLRGNAFIAFANLMQLTLMDYGTLLLGLLCGLRLAWRLWTGPSPSIDVTSADVAQRHLEAHLLLWTAIGFAAAKTLLVLLVEPAGPRYMTPAMSLLPAVLAVWFAHACSESMGNPHSTEAEVPIHPARNE